MSADTRYKPGSKMLMDPNGCDDCGPNYCYCAADAPAPVAETDVIPMEQIMAEYTPDVAIDLLYAVKQNGRGELVIWEGQTQVLRAVLRKAFPAPVAETDVEGLAEKLMQRSPYAFTVVDAELVIAAAAALRALQRERDEFFKWRDRAAQLDREKTVRTVNAEAAAAAYKARIADIEDAFIRCEGLDDYRALKATVVAIRAALSKAEEGGQ